MSKEKMFQVVGATLDAVSTLEEAVRCNEHAYYWKRLQECAKALFERGPFKEGDRVRLTRTPEINENTSWGWIGSKHFLVAGALATVREVDFYDGRFVAGLHFDDESWISFDGQVHPAAEKALYYFDEGWLERIELSSPTPAK